MAHILARRLGAVVLSVDSMMVYRGMDIGTAKPCAKERDGLHYLGIDCAEPSEEYSVWEYRRMALSGLGELGQEAVIAVGGSGLYVKALTEGLDAAAGPNAADFERLGEVVDREGITATLERLLHEKPELVERVPAELNRRRLIRLLWIAETGGEARERHWPKPERPLLTGLRMGRAELVARVERRTQTMYQSGLLNEARALLSRHATLSRSARQAIGYSEAIACIEGRTDEAVAMAETVRRTRQLVKKQGTWFRTQAAVDWIDCEQNRPIEAVAELVLASWKRYGPVHLADEN